MTDFVTEAFSALDGKTYTNYGSSVVVIPENEAQTDGRPFKFGAPRTKIRLENTPGTNWEQTFNSVRITEKVTGRIIVKATNTTDLENIVDDVMSLLRTYGKAFVVQPGVNQNNNSDAFTKILNVKMTT